MTQRSPERLILDELVSGLESVVSRSEAVRFIQTLSAEVETASAAGHGPLGG